MERPQPTHLDQRDPADADVRGIREEVDREVDAYEDLAAVVLLVPEDRWAEFLDAVGEPAGRDEIGYRGVVLRKAAVTAVVAQEGF